MTREEVNPQARPAQAFDAGSYGAALAQRYDALYPGEGLETQAAVTLLAELARRRTSGAVLEFGIGTGRLALPLQKLGVPVAGVDASREMVDVLRQKVGGTEIEVAIGDIASTGVARQFSVVVSTLNGILDERGTDTQLAIFANATAHLEVGGCFVVEALVLSDNARDGGWSVSPRYVGQEHAELEMARYDLETSVIERTLVHLRPEGAEFISVKDVYAAPGELDLMARVHGMSRLARYASWARAPFTSRSQRHVTVYEKRA